MYQASALRRFVYFEQASIWNADAFRVKLLEKVQQTLTLQLTEMQISDTCMQRAQFCHDIPQ